MSQQNVWLEVNTGTRKEADIFHLIGLSFLLHL